MRGFKGMWDLRSVRRVWDVRGLRDVRPDPSQKRWRMGESECFGNLILEVWLEARWVYCSVSGEI